MVEAREVGEKHSDREEFIEVEKTQIHAAVCVRVLPSGAAPLGGGEVLVFPRRPTRKHAAVLAARKTVMCGGGLDGG
jgi:hypothetical protein